LSWWLLARESQALAKLKKDQEAKKRVTVDASFEAYSVKLRKPMGITFEEADGGVGDPSAVAPRTPIPSHSKVAAQGLFVKKLSKANSDKNNHFNLENKIALGDVLIEVDGQKCAGTPLAVPINSALHRS